jgi:RND family efflux transporter MFP subunit
MIKLNVTEQLQWLKAGPRWRLYGAAALVVGLVAVTWLVHRWHSTTSPNSASQAPTVAVVAVHREDLYHAITIPAEFRPYVEVQLHAKVSGYLQQMNVDFGDRVKAGQLLATLEVPELHDQLHNAIATEQKAEADYTNAHLIYIRLQAVNQDHPNLVAQQDLDTAEARDGSAAAAIAAAKADMEKFQTLVKYTQITAPFDGVITRRYADPGALIQAGTASDLQAMPLVRLSDNYHLRMDFYVDVGNVKDIQLGDPVEVRVDSLGGRTFTGRISRFTDRVEEDTRKMTTEIEVPNPNLELVPGMYATVVLKVERRPQALTLPTQAIRGDNKNTVFVVSQNQTLEERPVTLGLEMPDKFEVLAGLKEGDLVVIGNHALVRPGQKVETKLVNLLATQ